jgi:hypothetical protein
MMNSNYDDHFSSYYKMQCVWKYLELGNMHILVPDSVCEGVIPNFRNGMIDILFETFRELDTMFSIPFTRQPHIIFGRRCQVYFILLHPPCPVPLISRANHGCSPALHGTQQVCYRSYLSAIGADQNATHAKGYSIPQLAGIPRSDYPSYRTCIEDECPLV